MKKLLVIDNFDSFTYNLVQYFGQSGAACDVIRNNQLSLEEIDISPFDGIVLSPGPCDPDRAGISLSAVKAWEGKKPLLGVCLGHQCIAQAYGGKRIGQTFKQIFVSVMNRGSFTVHEPVCSNNASAICLSNTLMPKTYPK